MSLVARDTHQLPEDVLVRILGTCPYCDASIAEDAITCPTCGKSAPTGLGRWWIVIGIAVAAVSLLLGAWAGAVVGGGEAITVAGFPPTEALTNDANSVVMSLDATGTTTQAVRDAATSVGTAAAAATTAVTSRGVSAATAAQASGCLRAWNGDDVARTSLASFLGAASSHSVRGVALQQPGRRCRISFRIVDGGTPTTPATRTMDYLQTPKGYSRVAPEVTRSGFENDLRGVAQPFALRADDAAKLTRVA